MWRRSATTVRERPQRSSWCRSPPRCRDRFAAMRRRSWIDLASASWPTTGRPWSRSAARRAASLGPLLVVDGAHASRAARACPEPPRGGRYAGRPSRSRVTPCRGASVLRAPALAWALSSSGDYASLESELRGQSGPAAAHALRARTRSPLRDGARRRSARWTPWRRRRRARRSSATHDLVRATLLADGDAAAVWAQVKPLLSIDPAADASVLAPVPRAARRPRARGGARRERRAGIRDARALPRRASSRRTEECRRDVARARLRALEAREPLPRAQVPPSFLRGEIDRGRGARLRGGGGAPRLRSASRGRAASGAAGRTRGACSFSRARSSGSVASTRRARSARGC